MIPFTMTRPQSIDRGDLEKWLLARITELQEDCARPLLDQREADMIRGAIKEHKLVLKQITNREAQE